MESSTSPTGSAVPAAPATINAAIPARLERTEKGDVQWLVEGSTYIRTALLIVDGLRPGQFVGTAPGGSITVNGVTYVVAPNGQAAFPDIIEGDRATDERAIKYLVLASTLYFVTCTLQVELASGRAW